MAITDKKGKIIKTSTCFCKVMSDCFNCEHKFVKAVPARILFARNKDGSTVRILAPFLKKDAMLYILETPRGIRFAMLYPDGQYFITDGGEYKDDVEGFHLLYTDGGDVAVEQTEQVEEAFSGELAWRIEYERQLEAAERASSAEREGEALVGYLRSLGLLP